MFFLLITLNDEQFVLQSRFTKGINRFIWF